MEKFKDITTNMFEFNQQKLKCVLYIIMFSDILINISINSMLIININTISNIIIHFIVLNFLTFSLLVIIYNILNLIKTNDSFKNTVEDLNHKIDILNKERHDFNNHINIISGYLQLSKYSNALQYAFKIKEKETS